MIAELNKKANNSLLIGFFVWFAGNIAKGIYVDNPLMVTLGWILVLIGMATFIYGCMQYAQAKGQNKWLGLLGLANLVGLIILFVLPDKNKTQTKK